MSLEKLQFEPNLPHELALKYTEGKIVEGRFGDQVFFTLSKPAGACMYLDLGVAQKINTLGLDKNEPFMIAKRWSGKKGDPVQWDVWRPEAGQRLPTQAELPSTDATGIAETELEAQIRAEILTRKARQVAGASVSAPAPAAVTTAPSQAPSNGHSNGTKPNGASSNGAPKPYAGSGIPVLPTKIPADVAFREVLAFVTIGLKEAGEQWTDESKQGMVSTIMIQCMRDGAIGIWNRGAK